MPQSDFESALVRARKIEQAVATWLMARGSSILPVYDYSGLGANKAPKLQAFSASESLVTPDLLVARRGVTCWLEVKWKSHAFHFRKRNEFETGIDLRLFRQYQRVREITGCKVWIVFAHRDENVVTCNEIGELDAMPSKRVSQWGSDGHPPMINWPLRHLHRLAEYAQIIPEAA